MRGPSDDRSIAAVSGPGTGRAGTARSGFGPDDPTAHEAPDEGQKPWEIVLPEEGATEDLGCSSPSSCCRATSSPSPAGSAAARPRSRAPSSGTDRRPGPRGAEPDLHAGPALYGPGRAMIDVHADLYRLRGADELVEIGFRRDDRGGHHAGRVARAAAAPRRPVLTVDLSLRPEFGEARVSPASTARAACATASSGRGPCAACWCAPAGISPSAPTCRRPSPRAPTSA